MFKLVMLSIAFAVATAEPSLISPLGLSLGLGGIIAPAIAAAPLAGINYRGPLSLAPGQPANILAADGRPLDTLSVNLDRAAHLTARVVDGDHLLKKRSVIGAPLIGAPIGVPGVVHGSLIAPAPVGIHGVGIVGPVAGLGWGGLTGHLLKKRSLVGAGLIGAPIGVPGVVHGGLIAPAPVGIHGAGLVGPVAGLGWGGLSGHLLKKRSLVGARLIGAPIGVPGVVHGGLVASAPIGIHGAGLVGHIAGLGWGR